ncbi:hypothetical protein A6R78_01670 [Bacillus velezensis]|nr:hypothetical protein A6R78_01670 [Bacillus velezensis]
MGSRSFKNKHKKIPRISLLPLVSLRCGREESKKALNILQIQLEEELINISSFKERRKIRQVELNKLEKEMTDLLEETKKDALKSKKSFANKLDFFLENWHTIDGADLNHELMSFINKIIWYAPRDSELPPQLKFEWRM